MFEFDPEKSASNKLKHGIDFHAARRLWKDPRRLEIPARSQDEPRIILIAAIRREIWSAVFTLRNNRIRIISVRKARSNEKELYHSG